MEAIRPGSAAHLRPPSQPHAQQPLIDVMTSQMTSQAEMTPPIAPLRAVSGYVRTLPKSDIDPTGLQRVTQPSLNSEESKSPPTPTSEEPVTPVSTVVDKMKNMSPEQMQLLMNMLSKLGDVGGGKMTENAYRKCPKAHTHNIHILHTPYYKHTHTTLMYTCILCV